MNFSHKGPPLWLPAQGGTTTDPETFCRRKAGSNPETARAADSRHGPNETSETAQIQTADMAIAEAFLVVVVQKEKDVMSGHN